MHVQCAAGAAPMDTITTQVIALYSAGYSAEQIADRTGRAIGFVIAKIRIWFDDSDPCWRDPRHGIEDL
jgi:hypothetical protein